MRTNWLRYLIVLALLLNGAVIGSHFYLVHRFAKSQPFPVGPIIAPLTGVSSRGEVVPESAASGYACHVIRYTSIHCHWCLQDEPAWRDFGDALRAHGCDSMLLAPSAADLPDDAQSTAAQKSIAVVSADTARALNLFATPTTIVVDRQWKVTWSKAGTLSPDDKKDALANLR